MQNEVGEKTRLAQVACTLDSNCKLKRKETYCFNCGASVRNQKYCKNCGSKLDWPNSFKFQSTLYKRDEGFGRKIKEKEDKKTFTLHLKTDKIKEDDEFYNQLKQLLDYFTFRYADNEDLNVWIGDEYSVIDLYEEYYSPGSNLKFYDHNENIYSLRGFCEPSYRNLVIYYTKYETKESVKWLVAHEFMHYHISKSYAVKKYIINKNEKLFAKYDFTPNYSDDIIHEMWYEEQVCNDFANFICGEHLTGIPDKCYDRVWWRNQKSNID